MSPYLQTESEIEERASDMIASIEKQKADLLGPLHEAKKQKLNSLEQKLETVQTYIDQADSLQVNHKIAGV